MGQIYDILNLKRYNNQIKDIHFVESLTQLQKLDLSENQIEDVHFVESLPHLQKLNLRINFIKSIHFSKPLDQLRSLNLRENQINDYSFLKLLPQLQRLNLSENEIKNIRFMELLTQLQHLNLSYNQINNIRYLKKFTQLQQLNLKENEIKNIHFVESLTQLQKLDLSYNQIKDIRFMESLNQLQWLDLSKNEIKKLPKELFQAWPLLHTLYISGNPIENIPKELFENRNINASQNLRGYFASIEQGSIINDEAKLIVVGNTTAGKTSLMRFIRESRYEKRQNSTHGIALTRWPVPDGNLQVNIWDFGGQEYYHATHRLFLDDHAVYVVVWETGTNTEQILLTDIYLNGLERRLPLEHFPYSYWLDSIRYYAPNSTILLVQNKIDITGKQDVSNDCFKPIYSVHRPAYHLSVYQANANKNSPFSPTWTAFQDFQANLINALQIDAAGYKLGIGWVVIRNAIRLLSETQRWMKYAEFEDYCRQAVVALHPPVRFDSAVEMSGLLAYLSGAASTTMYYANDVRLRDIVFLNPQWVTDTIYDILNYQIREKNNNPGEFTREDAMQALDEKGIGELTDKFLELMKKDRFELIFEKPNRLNEYIAPQYLPDTRGEKDIRRFRSRTLHSFTLHFPRFLPRSVFLRFMVRYGNLATEIYWKYGIVLEKSGIDILAECMFSERKIRIAIEGDPKNQFAQQLFEGLWRLSDVKSDIEVSINETDFVEIGDLIDSLDQVRSIRSKQGAWLKIEDFFHLFGKDLDPKPEKPSNKTPEPSTPEIFFSYAWGDDYETGESREKIVDDLYESLRKDRHRVVRDKMDLGYKRLISKFINRIGKGSVIIVAISDKYLKSPYCMFELLEIYRNARLERDQFINVIYPIRLESLALNKPAVQTTYFDYWSKEEKAWKKLVSRHRVNKAQTDAYDKVCRIHNELGDLLGHLSDMNSLTKELLSANNFAEIKEAIKAHIESPKS